MAGQRGVVSRRFAQIAGVGLTAFAVAALGIATFQRNTVYSSELSILRDTVAKAPGNARAHNTLGAKLVACGHVAEAIGQVQKALELEPGYANAHCNLGLCFGVVGRVDEAVNQYREALRSILSWQRPATTLATRWQAGAIPGRRFRVSPRPEAQARIGRQLRCVGEAVGHLFRRVDPQRRRSRRR